MKTIKEYLEDQLYQDLCYTYVEIDESGGLYDGQLELSTKITNDIENKLPDILKYKYNDFNIKNIYFNELDINITYFDATNHTSNVICLIDFISNNNKWDDFKKYNFDKETNRLDKITIDLKCPKQVNIYYDNIRSRISHELNHGYVYWQIIKDDFSEKNIVPDNYHNKLHEWSNNIYNKIAKHIKNPTNNETEQICYNLVYTLTRYERNAFLSEIVTYLFDRNNVFKNTNDLRNELNKSAQYKLYTDEGPKIIGIIKKYWSKNKQQILADTYNKIYNTKYTSKKIINLLEFKIEETIKKINKNINTLSRKYKNGINENINENISYIHFPNELDLF